MSGTVSKSYQTSADPVITYCAKHTVKQSQLEKDIQEKTLSEHERSIMLGAPEVLQLGKNFIKLIKGKKALDIGTFTSASAVAWATALPEDGQVYTFDVSHQAFEAVGKPVLSKHPEIEKKITFKLGPALEHLDQLIADGQSGTFDFVFIDADKENYSNYYHRAMKLLRSGGVILVDNSLRSVAVAKDPSTFTEDAAAIDACNKLIFEDEASASALVNLGDGTHIVFKN